MKASHRILPLALLPLLLLPALAAEERGRFRPGYERDGARRQALRKAPRAKLPDDLRMAKPNESTATTQPAEDDDGAGMRAPGHAADSRRRSVGKSGDRANHDDDRYRLEMDRRARRAARWAAEEIAMSTGRREYYRAGVHQGLRTALQDARLGEWDYRQGLRLGQRDREARRLGFEVGGEAAGDAAREAAAAQVASQYMDLTREPKRDPRFTVPAWTTEDSWTAPVMLHEVFESNPPRLFPDLGGRLALAFADWSYDPWELYRVRRHVDFYDAGWKTPHLGFEFWKSRRPSHSFAGLDRDERLRFRNVFEAEFADRIPLMFRRHLAPAFDRGFEDGWDYGAFVSYEWNFRRGYNAGFDLAVSDTAALTYSREFGPAYVEAYETSFERWANSARPGNLSITLRDGNDDGVFEPGESLQVRFELANFGGRAGSFSAIFDGEVLEDAAREEVRLPARQMTVGELNDLARVDPRAPLHTRGEVVLFLGGLEQRVPLRVSYPLEIAGAPTIDHIDALAGTMVVSARVVNASRRGVHAGVTLAEVSGYDRADEVEPEYLDPGQQRQVTFAVEGLRSVDLLAGRPSVRLEAHDGERLHDSRTLSTPNLSLDLGDRTLVRFLVALARDPRASESDILQAHRLMLDRLRVDWREAIRGWGNPYKKDRRKGTNRTALGDLVQTYHRERDSALRPEVFENLQNEIIELSHGLPGTHPFLRRAMRRLAKDLS
jgi:hypothetical protein